MTKKEIVANQLRSGITSGAYREGEKLPSEAELCEKYGISRMTVRGVIDILVAQGYIETYKGKGSFVKRTGEKSGSSLLLSAVNRTDLFEFRRIFETEIAGIAAQRASQELIDALRDAALQMKAAESVADIAFYDVKFHELLAEATRNSVIRDIFDCLRGPFQTMFEQNVEVMGAEGSMYHLKIVAAIQARNSELARSYMQEHLNNTMQSMNMMEYEHEQG